MTSAVDANVVLDLGKSTAQALASHELLSRLGAEGPLIISEPAYAEVAAAFVNDRSGFESLLVDIGIVLVNSNPRVLYVAGLAWREYSQRRPRTLACPACGTAQSVACSACGAPIRTCQHLVADFLIGAHALILAERLVTRDRGFYAAYFPDLELA